jgi:GNAT superfamily N-acetyltransferase
MSETAWRIRRASPDDSAGIAKVHVQAWHETYKGIVPDSVLDGLDVADRTARWQKILTDNVERSAAFVAEMPEDGIVGFVHCSPLRDRCNGSGGEITAIYVLRSAQRRGIGRGLFGVAAAFLKSLGMTELTIWVLAENQPARRFYVALGGMVTEEKIVTIGRPMPEVAYFWPDVEDLLSPC